MVSFLALLAFALAFQATPRDTRAPGPAATISGRVTERASGRPLPRMVVALESRSSVRLETLTDGDGRYELANVPPGAYTLSASPEPHRSTYLPMRFGEDRPVTYLGAPSRENLELKSGESRANVDFALRRALAVEGRVVDPWERPMTNVQVSVRHADGGTVAGRGSTTNDLGQYRIYGLPPGRYRVCTDQLGEGGDVGDLRIVRTCHMAALSASEASDVVLEAGHASNIDIRVQRVRSYTIAGAVSDAVGSTVRRGWVGAFPADHEGGTTSSTTTDADGQFLLKGLIPGRYLLSASVGGSQAGDPNPPSREREVGYATVDLQADTSVGTMALSKPVTVFGVVSFDGKPAPSPRQLRLLTFTRPIDERWSRYEMRQPQAAVDDNLRFELKGLYRLPQVIAISNIPENWALKSINYQGRDITYLGTDFSGARSDSPVQIVLTNRVARPSVRVNESGPFHVLIMPANPAMRRLGLKMFSGDRARNGVLSLGALVPGDYLVAAVAAEDIGDVFSIPVRLNALAGVATPLTLREGEEPTVDLSLTRLPPQR